MKKRQLLAGFVLLAMVFTLGCKEKTAPNHESLAAVQRDSVMVFKVSNKANKLVRDGGEQIDREEADRLIGGYRDENSRVWHPLRSTDDRTVLKGFTISKRVFDELLHQGDADGVRIYFAKDPSADKRYYTTVLVATKADEEGHAQQLDIQDLFYEHVDPCPTHCATNDNYGVAAMKNTDKKK